MEELTVAWVRRAHGLDGEVLVKTETDDGAEIFVPDRPLSVRRAGRDAADEVLTVTTSRPHRGGFLLRFREIAGREAADRLLGAELRLHRDELRPLAEDEYFLHDLVGLEIVDEAAGRLGVVKDVYDAAGHWLAGVEVDGREHLVPLRPETVRRVDVEAGRIETTLPPGLMEL
jgi:16S rRNA processing protein RimM